MVQVGVESENGWRPPDLRPGDPLLVWKTVPGTDPPVNIQVMRGLPEVFLPAWVADWNAYIEHVDDGDTASYTDGNSVFTSNHKNGTAVDTDWKKHPFHEYSFTDEQLATVHEMVDFYEGWMFWAGDWQDPIDQMHSQMGYNTWNRNTAALDFIHRKIRSDGLSTFRRGELAAGDPPGAAGPPATPTPDTPVDPTRDGHDSTDTAAQVLYDAVPVIDLPRATELVASIMAGLALALCTNVSRIAEFLAQTGHEADGYQTTEEYADGSEYDITNNRELALELGNTAPGDGVKYKGRTWIQITGKAHYAAFGQWCVQQGLLTNPDFFVANPTALGDLQWAGIGAAWYWTVERPQINAMCDRGDLLGVTKAINGGTNGLQDRTDRYNQALALGDRLLLLIQKDTPAPTPAGGPLMALSDDEQQELLIKTRDIWDQLRGPGGNGWPQLGTADDGNGLTIVDALADVIYLIQGLVDAAKKAPPRPPAKKAAPKKAAAK